jgi:hypothetical protein
MSTRSIRPRIRSPSRPKLNSRSTYAGTTVPGCKLLLAEAAQRGRPAARRASSCSRVRKPSLDQARSKAASSSSSVITMPARLQAMELLNGLVQRRAVDDRVVRRDRHPQDVDVLVLERTGQVVVHLVEAQRERPSTGSRPGLNRLRLRLECGQPLQRRMWAGLGSRAGRGRSPAGPAPRGRTATRAERACRRSPPRGTGSARRGPASCPHRRAAAPPGRAGVALRQNVSWTSSAGRASGSRRVRAGKRPSTRPVMKTTGNSRPLALCTVSTATASASGSTSAVAGSSPASISVCRLRATNMTRSSAPGPTEPG